MMEVRSEVIEKGYLLQLGTRRQGLLRSKTSFDLASDWDAALAKTRPLTAAIIDELEQAGKLRRQSTGSRFLSFGAAAELQNSDAEALNLLPPFPYQLDVQSRG